MGTETLPSATTVASGLLIKSADFLTTNAALQAAFVGRNTSGLPSSGQSLGTSLYPWGNLYTNSITVGGSVIDLSGIVSPANRVVSGRVRTTSGQPQFLQANGAAATVQVLGTATNLVLSINSATVTVATDISETGLTVAPAANNTCAINDTSFVDQEESKYYGEVDGGKTIITIDTVGTEISARVGQFISLKTATSEIMFGWLKSATEFVSVKRGYFFDSTSPQPIPIVRETIANNDVLTLMETGWLFVEDDALTVDISYLTPVYAYTAPGSPAASQYWYDISNVEWKRWSGSAWASVNRIPVGLCVIDGANCIATRSFDFYGDFKDENTIDCEVFSDEVIRSVEGSSSVNVYGTSLVFQDYPVEFNNTTDMEGAAVTTDEIYYLYLSTTGQPKISLERPYDRTGDLNGKYHPYNNWRYICDAKTDASSDWLSVLSSSAFDHVTPSADFESKDLLLDVSTAEQVTMSYTSLSFLNSAYVPKRLFNDSDIFDITQHLMPGTTEKNSHIYQLWKDWSRKLLMVPDLTGTADSNVLNSLSSSAMTFQADLVQRWDEIYQTDDNTKGYVKAVSSETVITCMDKDGNDLDLFPLGTENFMIRMLSPVGLGAHKSRVGSVRNDSSSNLINSFYTQIQEGKIYTGGTDYDVTGQAGFSLIKSRLEVKQKNDWLGNGSWFVSGQTRYDQTSGVLATIAFSGLIFLTAAGEQSCAGNQVSSNGRWTNYCYADGGTSNVVMDIDTASENFTIQIDAEVATKPTFHK